MQMIPKTIFPTLHNYSNLLTSISTYCDSFSCFIINIAAMVIVLKCKPGHVISLVKTLQWLPVTFRIKFKPLVLASKSY